jgi:glycosyltransferase involved in cell wall biosynthesis
MRIAIVLGASTGGIGAHVRDLAAALVRRGDEVRILAPRRTIEHFDLDGTGARCVPVDIAAATRGRHPRELWRLRRSVTAARIDLVHAHGFRAAAAARLALSGRRVPLVVTLHNTMANGGPGSVLSTRLERFAVAGARVVLGASNDLVLRARDIGARDVGFGPVAAPDLMAPTRSREQIRTELGVGDRQVLLLAVGRLAPQKDYPLMLDALHRSAVIPDPAARAVILMIAGEGPLRAELQAQIDRLGLPARLLGPRTDVADLLSAADLFLLSSQWEARPLVIQEAMRAGVPLLATAVGGIPDLVGDAAALVPHADPEAYARALTALIRDCGERARRAAAGLDQAKAWPDAAACFAVIAAAYAEAAASR